MSNFFIAGLPRSRTAWFAAYFSAHPDVWCWHEGLKGCADPAEFNHKMHQPGHTIVGNSDSGLPLCNIHLMFPDAPVVIIHRDYKDVMQSLGLEIGAHRHQPMVDLLNNLYDCIMRMRGLHVMFDDIDERMMEISQWLGIPYREDIHDLYQPLNIQTTDLEPDATALEWLPFAQ